MKSLYDKASIVFNKKSKEIKVPPLVVNQGLRQGVWTFPSTVWPVYKYVFIRPEMNKSKKGLQLRNNKHLNRILFADREVFLAKDHLQENITK
jgi:hypothetical protein